MELVATKILGLSPSMTLSITNQANELIAAGEDVCAFAAGEPDFDTPDFIKEAAVKALDEGKTKYTAASGLKELKEALAAKFLIDNNIEYNPGQISVNCGAKHSCFNAILACCDAGDEVIIPAPYWTSYPEMVRMAGAKPVIVETKEENGWKITPEEFENAMTGRTAMIILNSPNNPTGAVYTRAELEKLAEIALEEEIVILSDEIYEKLTYNDQEHVSIASISDEVKEITITVNGFSKAYAMTGWRLGYTAASYELTKAMNTIQSHSTSAPTTFAQYGALAALQGEQAAVTDMRDEFDAEPPATDQEHPCYRATRSILLPGEHRADRHQVGELLREASKPLEDCRRSWHRLWNRVHPAFLLRGQPASHQCRYGSLYRVLRSALSVLLIIFEHKKADAGIPASALFL